MVANVFKCAIGSFLVFGLSNAIAHEGIVLSMDESWHSSNKCAVIKLVLRKDNLTLPQFMTVCRPQSDFIALGKQALATVKVNCEIRIYNNTDWTYVFGKQSMFTGYDSLEFDLLLENGKTICMKKRKPAFLHDDGSLILLNPHCQWVCLVSFDRRLWDVPMEISTSRVVKIRPRFAFGAYYVDGTYYRTIDEIGDVKRNRKFNDREGELVGDWIDCSFDENFTELQSDSSGAQKSK